MRNTWFCCVLCAGFPVVDLGLVLIMGGWAGGWRFCDFAVVLGFDLRLCSLLAVLSGVLICRRVWFCGFGV